MSLSSSSSYKCMLLVPRDQYEQMKAAKPTEPAAGLNSVESGIGGDVNDSNVQNIDVSEGATLVINDRDSRCDGGHHHTHSQEPDRQYQHRHGEKLELAKDGGYPQPVLVAGAPHSSTTTTSYHFQPPPSNPPAQVTSSGAPSTSATATTVPSTTTTQQTGVKGTKRVRVKAASTSAASAPQMSQKSTHLLNTLVQKRVAELAGRRPPAKKRRKTLSDGDLNRAVVHDLRDASRQVEAAAPSRPTLTTRRLNRYRAQVAKIRPYVDPPARGQVAVVQPHRVPLPPSSDEDEGDPPRRMAVVGAARRTVPRRLLYTTRSPQAVKRTEPTPGGRIDPFHYEPREKVANLRRAPVRRVGAFARHKRPVSKTADQRRWERLNFPEKRVIRPEELPLSSGDEDLASDPGD